MFLILKHKIFDLQHLPVLKITPNVQKIYLFIKLTDLQPLIIRKTLELTALKPELFSKIYIVHPRQK